MVHVLQAVDDAHRTGSDFLSNRPALCLDRATAFERVAQFRRIAGLAFDGLRAGLQDVEAAVHAVLAPFDVHRAAVMRLNHQRVAGQLQHVLVAQRVAVAHFRRHIAGGDQFAASRFFCSIGKLHLQQLGTQITADNGREPGAQGGFVYVELIRVHRALHHHFAQTIARGDEDHVIKARFRVQGEHHTCGAFVGAHHALHTGAERHHVVGKTFVHPVADRAVVVERGEHLSHLVQHGVNAGDVQKSFLLPGKRGVWQIFGGGRRAHREGGLRVGPGQSDKSSAHRLLKCGRQRLRLHQRADARADLRQGTHLFAVPLRQFRADFLVQTAVTQKLAVRMRGGGKAPRHFHALRQLGDHFSQAGIFAPYSLHIRHPQVLKRHDPIGLLKQV